MNEQRENQEFEAFLSGKSALKRPYKQLGQEQPPAAVDQHILAEARKAAEIHRREFGPRGGWLKPVALAATVLLSFTLVTQLNVDVPVNDNSVVPQDARSPLAQESAREIRMKMSAPEAKLRQESVASSAPLIELEDMVRRQPASADEQLTASAIQESVAALGAPDQTFAIIAAYLAASDKTRIQAETVTNRVSGLAAQSSSVQAELMVMEEREFTADAPDVADTDVMADELSADADWDPDTMLRTIARLDAEQKRDQAQDLLDDFLLRYPAHPVSVKILTVKEAP